LELDETLKKRHMCREFEERHVEPDKVSRLLYAAGRAPQGGNMPVREFVVVDDPGRMKLLRGVTPSFLANCPMAIVVCTDLERAAEVMGLQGRDTLSLLDAGAAAENVALEAVSLGLGVSFVRSATERAAKKALDLPERYRIDIIIGIGYESRHRRAPMRAAKPVVHRNSFGEKWVD
jgi:nitroreductase